MNETTIVALEVGSSKIKGAVGVIDETGSITVQAVEEESLLDSVRYGIVSNAEDVAFHALKLLDRLEQRFGGRTIQGAYVAIGGRSLRSEGREKEILLPQEMEITQDIIEELINETASTVSPNRELLDVVPRSFYVDKSRVGKPIGSLGSSVKMQSNIITCRQQLKRNLRHLVEEKLGLDIYGYEVRPLVEADFVLTQEEKRLGCVMVDCGAETTTVSVYKHGHLQFLSTLPMGSRNITRDLTHLSMLEERAEEVKHQYGDVSGNTPAPADDSIDINQVNKYVACRAEEIILNIIEQINESGLESKDLPGGVILIGRGSRLAGFSDRLSDISKLKIRFGNPVRSDLRVADRRTLMADSVDVISTLYAAAHHNPTECLTTAIAPEEPEKEFEVEEVATEVAKETAPEIAIDEGKTKSERPKKPGRKLFDSFLSRLSTLTDYMMEESEDDGVMESDED